MKAKPIQKLAASEEAMLGRLLKVQVHA